MRKVHSSFAFVIDSYTLLVALSLSLACTIVELVGFFSGLSMFSSLPSMFSIASHVGASIAVALFTVNEWSCDDYWYIFCFCSVPAVCLEALVILVTVRCKVFT